MAPPEESGSLIAWTVQRTGWTVRDLPEFRTVSHAQLEAMFEAAKESHYRIESLYSKTERTVYLPDTWRSENLRDRSILLHELIHHLQYLNNVEEVCRGDSEYDATELQMSWLREQGVDDPLDLLGMNALFVYMLRRCGE